ncbi:MAG TPA: zinc ribbon domain-containing protein [Blastocatellia bacterium]|nr:zinc ribbon domain-containing protein [Blastocatellia bacterium]
MHCPVCGAESTQGLNYCKRCGASLVAGKQSLNTGLDIGRLAGMFWAVAAFGLGGLALLIGCVLGVVAMGVTGEMVGIVSIIFLATILIISALLIRQLSRLISIFADSREEAARMRAIEADAPLQIESPPRAMPSVTEHTTRNIDQSSFEEKRVTR